MAKETHHRYFFKKNLFAIYRKFHTLINEHRKRQVRNFIFPAPYIGSSYSRVGQIYQTTFNDTGALHIGANLEKYEEISRLLESGCTEMQTKSIKPLKIYFLLVM